MQKEIRSPIEQSQDYRLCFAEAFPRTAKTRLIFAWQPSLARSNRPMQTPKKAAVPKNAPCNPARRDLFVTAAEAEDAVGKLVDFLMRGDVEAMKNIEARDLILGTAVTLYVS